MTTAGAPTYYADPPPPRLPVPCADSRTTLVFNMPLAEVVTDYFDQLKSRSKGYASMEYKIIGYRWVTAVAGLGWVERCVSEATQ